ncbi:MAG: cyclic peptide export ABC transporter [Cyclobacteriaceae bacterium]
MKFLFFLVEGVWKRFLLVVTLSAVAGGLYTLSIRYLHLLINDSTDWKTNLAIVVTSVLVSSVIAVWSSYFLTNLYEQRIASLRVKLCQQIISAKFEKVERNQDRIIPVLQNDINSMTAFTKSIGDMLVAIFKIVAIIGYLFYLSWSFGLFIVAVFTLILIVNTLFLRPIYQTNQVIKKTRNEVHRQLDGLVRGIKELSLSVSHHSLYVNENIGAGSMLYGRLMTRINTINVFLMKLSELIAVVTIAVLVIYLHHQGNLVVNDFFESITLVIFLLPSLIVATVFLRNLKKFKVSLEQIEGLGLEFRETKPLPYNQLEITENSQEALIELKELVYQYDSHGYQLGPVDLKLERGQIVLIRGGNGSGKTTLAKVLTGLYEPEKGSLLFQGKPVTKEDLAGYRDLFSAVFADSFVFQNLRYLADKVRAQDIVEAAKLLEIADKLDIEKLFIQNVQLSMGQRGRINLFRALLENKPVVLFDEWAANQDPHFKEVFYSEIIPRLKNLGKTIILITHDEKYFHIADKVVEMSAGKIEN